MNVRHEVQTHPIWKNYLGFFQCWGRSRHHRHELPTQTCPNLVRQVCLLVQDPISMEGFAPITRQDLVYGFENHLQPPLRIHNTLRRFRLAAFPIFHQSSLERTKHVCVTRLQPPRHPSRNKNQTQPALPSQFVN